MPITCFKSVLDVYELVLQRSTNWSNSANKVKQETLQALGILPKCLIFVLAFCLSFFEL